LTGLQPDQADTNGFVTWRSLADHVQTEVPRLSEGRQRPQAVMDGSGDPVLSIPSNGLLDGGTKLGPQRLMSDQIETGFDFTVTFDEDRTGAVTNDAAIGEKAVSGGIWSQTSYTGHFTRSTGSWLGAGILHVDQARSGFEQQIPPDGLLFTSFDCNAASKYAPKCEDIDSRHPKDGWIIVFGIPLRFDNRGNVYYSRPFERERRVGRISVSDR
jgi:hypothetical protein